MQKSSFTLPCRPLAVALSLFLARRFLQPVTNAANGADEPACVGEFLADGGDVDVDGAIGDEDVGSHRLVHELIAREHPAAGGDQCGEELELRKRELYGLAIEGDLVLVRVDVQR